MRTVMSHPYLLVGALLLTTDVATASAPPTVQGPPGLLSQVGIDQKLGADVAMDVALTDSSAKTVKLGDLFGDRPVVLTALAQWAAEMVIVAKSSELYWSFFMPAIHPAAMPSWFLKSNNSSTHSMRFLLKPRPKAIAID